MKKFALTIAVLFAVLAPASPALAHHECEDRWVAPNSPACQEKEEASTVVLASDPTQRGDHEHQSLELTENDQAPVATSDPDRDLSQPIVSASDVPYGTSQPGGDENGSSVLKIVGVILLGALGFGLFGLGLYRQMRISRERGRHRR